MSFKDAADVLESLRCDVRNAPFPWHRLSIQSQHALMILNREEDRNAELAEARAEVASRTESEFVATMESRRLAAEVAALRAELEASRAMHADMCREVETMAASVFQQENSKLKAERLTLAVAIVSLTGDGSALLGKSEVTALALAERIVAESASSRERRLAEALLETASLRRGCDCRNDQEFGPCRSCAEDEDARSEARAVLAASPEPAKATRTIDIKTIGTRIGLALRDQP